MGEVFRSQAGRTRVAFVGGNSSFNCHLEAGSGSQTKVFSQGNDMAPEVGLEPTTTRLIPTRRDSTIEQLLSNPACGFHGFDLPLSSHGGGSRRMLLAPDHFPGPILPRKDTHDLIGAVVGAKPLLGVCGVANIEFPPAVLQNVSPEHIPSPCSKSGPRGRTQTYNHTVNPGSSGLSH